MMRWKKPLETFEDHLRYEEKADATIQKYLCDIQQFIEYLGEAELNKEQVLAYKQELISRYKASSINSKLAAINAFLGFLGRRDCRVKQLRIQTSFFSQQGEILTQKEYERLVETAERQGEKQLSLIMQTICSTGIRVSELPFITVETVKRQYAYITNKGKTRMLILSKQLKRMLLAFCTRSGITSGPVFITKRGTPIDRSVIWRKMKKLCSIAQVNTQKVFPHNLRHLFAVTFYKQEKDLLGLAEILGHTSIETTRIYTRTDYREYRQIVSGLGLLCDRITRNT